MFSAKNCRHGRGREGITAKECESVLVFQCSLRFLNGAYEGWCLFYVVDVVKVDEGCIFKRHGSVSVSSVCIGFVGFGFHFHFVKKDFGARLSERGNYFGFCETEVKGTSIGKKMNGRELAGYIHT